MGDIDVNRLTEEELDRLLVEMIMKMSPEQLAEAAEMVFAEKENVEEGNGAA